MLKNAAILLASTATIAAIGFDNEAGWKKDADGKLIVDANGNPIYVDTNGTEQAVEQGTISRLNAEAKTHRTAKETAEAKLKAFEGITDPAAARAALETVGRLDQKALIDAGEVDKVKQQITEQFTGQLNEAKNTNDKLKSDNDQLRLGRAFDRSDFIRDRIAVPREMFENTFAKNFKIDENGKVVPYGMDGNPVYSKKRMGEIADIDEALEIMVDGYSHKDSILKAEGGGGSGNGGGGGNRGTGRRMSRSEFDGLAGNQQAEAAAAMGKGELTIVD